MAVKYRGRVFLQCVQRRCFREGVVQDTDDYQYYCLGHWKGKKL